jgi:hypothetical protein
MDEENVLKSKCKLWSELREEETDSRGMAVANVGKGNPSRPQCSSLCFTTGTAQAGQPSTVASSLIPRDSI